MVNLYLTTFRYDEWEKFAEELQVRIKIKRNIFFRKQVLKMDFMLNLAIPALKMDVLKRFTMSS